MTRTDVHSPTNLVTEDYDFAFAYDSHPEEGDGRWRVEQMGRLMADGWTFGENSSAGDCYHCGARLRYVAVLMHRPTHSLVKVGEQCLENRFELASVEFHRLRKAAELNRARQAIKHRRLAWFAVDQDRQVAFEWADAMVNDGDYGYSGMRHNFVHTVRRYGDTTDKFVRAIMRDMVRTERRAEERAAQEALARPVVGGQGVTVEGEVVSVKWHDNDYGGKLVMTVKDDRGFLVWGTVPAAIDSVERGQRVRFVANVEASDRDETFGFFRRPRKATIVDG